jgi:peptidoglycan-N-acetylglucosamine deacetylase
MNKHVVALLIGFIFLVNTANASASQHLIAGDFPEGFEFTGQLTAYRERMAALNAAHPGEIIFHGPADKKEIALTFDDGPDLEFVPQVLEILKGHGIVATFFFLGDRLTPKHKGIFDQVRAEGHTILSHGWDHRRYTEVGTTTAIDLEIIAEDITKGMNALAGMLGEKPHSFMRPPYGNLTEEILAVFRKLRVTPILWSIDPLDWAATVPSELIVESVIKYAHPGAIVLLHTKKGQERTVDALPGIVEGLLAKEYTFVTLEKMLGFSKPVESPEE